MLRLSLCLNYCNLLLSPCPQNATLKSSVNNVIILAKPLSEFSKTLWQFPVLQCFKCKLFARTAEVLHNFPLGSQPKLSAFHCSSSHFLSPFFLNLFPAIYVFFSCSKSFPTNSLKVVCPEFFLMWIAPSVGFSDLTLPENVFPVSGAVLAEG